MPVTPTYPGVYIEEIPSGVRTVVGVATSITAFIGRALRGPANKPIRIQSFADFERIFGGLWVVSALGYSVQHFFLNGGTDALIVRVLHDNDANPANNASKSVLAALAGPGTSLTLEAANEGSWGDNLRARVDLDTRPLDPGEPLNSLFNLYVKDMGLNAVEVFRNVSSDPNNRRFVTHVLEIDSQLVRVSGAAPTSAPNASTLPPIGLNPFDVDLSPPHTVYVANATPGSDGIDIDDTNVLGLVANKTGIYALELADLFNLMVIPPLRREAGDVQQNTYENARIYCSKRRAMLIADAPFTTVLHAVDGETTGPGTLASRDRNAAIFFPRIRVADPLKENRLETFAPSGAIAGIFARTDTDRGVWKAPAGRDATLAGVKELSVPMTDGENGQLNPLAVNCLRSFPVAGNVVWGARTYAGADLLASEWKYIPVRRLALYLEESLYRGTQWVVFEPNDEPLWAQIRLNVGAFMQDLFRKGAFQGSNPRDAYLVKCDKDTTTQGDINLGIVNILVGFAPLKPAEFVIIKIQQLAGNIQV
jgi:phage tail sheath protein FI